MALDLLGLKETEVKNIDLNSIIDFQSSGINETLTEGASFVEKEIVYNKGAEKVPLAFSVSPILEEKARSTGAVIIITGFNGNQAIAGKSAAVGTAGGDWGAGGRCCP